MAQCQFGLLIIKWMKVVQTDIEWLHSKVYLSLSVSK